jgi:uncharacterized integral membrane protein
MGKHEIRLRRQRVTARGSDRFRNYNTIVKRHEQDQRIKKIVRIFVFFAIVLILILVFIMVNRWEEKQSKSKASISFTLLKSNSMLRS